MFSKTKYAMFALAAVVTVGTASLAASSAEARGFGGGFRAGGGMHVGMHVGGPRVGFARANFGRVGFNHFRFNHFRPHFAFNHFRFNHWRFHHRWWWNHHHRWPYYVGGGAVYSGTTPLSAGPSYAAAQPQAPASTCTCLNKQYTQDGLVVFQDVCTKEVASAPVGNTQAQLPQQQQGQPQQQ